MKDKKFSTKNKDFDCIKMQHIIREKLSKEWIDNPDKVIKRLNTIPEKYKDLYKKAIKNND